MPLSFQTLENSIRPRIPPCFWEGWMLPSILLFSSCIALLFHATRKKLFYPYSLLWEGVDFISIYTYTYISFKNIFYHPSCFSHFKLQKNAIGSLISFLEGLISVYFSINSSINFHGSINPCFWEGVDVACQTFLLFILHCSVIPYC